MSEKTKTDQVAADFLAQLAAEFPPLIRKYGVENASAVADAVGKVFEAFKDVPDACILDTVQVIRRGLDSIDAIRVRMEGEAR